MITFASYHWPQSTAAAVGKVFNFVGVFLIYYAIAQMKSLSDGCWWRSLLENVCIKFQHNSSTCLHLPWIHTTMKRGNSFRWMLEIITPQSFTQIIQAGNLHRNIKAGECQTETTTGRDKTRSQEQKAETTFVFLFYGGGQPAFNRPPSMLECGPE